jgi:outer membrane protein assembly factor BamB
VPAFWEVRDPRAGTPWKGTPGSSGLLLFFVDDHLYAVSASGHLKWRFRTPGAAVTSTPAIDADGTIYVGSHDGFVYAVGPDGEMKWRFPTGGSVASSPAIDASGTVIVGSDDGSLYAIGKDGTQRWRLRNGRVERSSPTRLSPQFAEPRFVWRRSETPVMRTSPAIAPDGTVYVASSDGCLYAVR